MTSDTTIEGLEPQDAPGAREDEASKESEAGTEAAGRRTGEADAFPREYVEKLRQEAAGHRTRANRAEKEATTLAERLQELEQERARMSEELERYVMEAQQARVAAAIITEATRLGFHDPEDAVRLLDAEAIGLSEDGAITGVAEALAELVKRKPHLVKSRAAGDAAAHGAASPVDMNAAIRRAAGVRA